MMEKTKKRCSYKNCNNPVFGKSFCILHYPKKEVKKISEKRKQNVEKKKEQKVELHKWFLELWDKRSDRNGNVRCFESDTLLSHTLFKNNSCCYSHYLPKSKYPQYAMEEWNVEIVHPDIHSLWERKPTECERMYKKYLKILNNVLKQVKNEENLV